MAQVNVYGIDPDTGGRTDTTWFGPAEIEEPQLTVIRQKVLALKPGQWLVLPYEDENYSLEAYIPYEVIGEVTFYTAK